MELIMIGDEEFQHGRRRPGVEHHRIQSRLGREGQIGKIVPVRATPSLVECLGPCDSRPLLRLFVVVAVVAVGVLLLLLLVVVVVSCRSYCSLVLLLLLRMMLMLLVLVLFMVVGMDMRCCWTC